MEPLHSTDDIIKDVKDYCEFGENRVYLLMGIARTSENKHLAKGDEIVFREVLKEEKDIRRKIDKLDSTAKNYTDDEGSHPVFRLYLSANARNTLDTYWNFRDRMNGWIKDLMNEDDAASFKLKKVDSHWKSELQKPSSRDETRFLFDFDDPRHTMEELKQEISKHTDIVTVRETPNGFHIVSESFNYNDLPDWVNKDVEALKNDDMIFMSYIGEGER